jgi:hypothetical protein
MDENEFEDKDRDLAIEEKTKLINDEDAARDAQRNMAWFALFGMLFYPFAVIISTLIGLDNAATVLGNIAPTYFVSVAAIVAAFYGKEAFDKKNNSQ